MDNVGWNDFIGKNSKCLTNAFEDLARYLFRKTHSVPYTLPYYKNHPGNETDVIECGGEIIGFQAKFFENEIDANNIIHSIDLAKKWNPHQTKIIVYTNKEFGIPKDNRINRKQQAVIDAAASHGIKVEWMFGNNILDAIKEYPLAYDIFFNQNSHIQALPYDVEDNNKAKFSRISSEIVCYDKIITINRNSYIEKVKENIDNHQNVVVVGESGSGKSAIVKLFYEQVAENPDVAFYVLDGGQLDANKLNDLFSLEQDYTFKDFCDYYRDFKTKILYVDSAEKLLEHSCSSVPLLLFGKLRKEGWVLVFTCKANCQKEFLEVVRQNYGLQLVAIEVSQISKEELTALADEHSIILPQDHKLLEQLCLPFYFARYAELGPYPQLDHVSFKEKIWNLKVRGSVRGGVQQKREECLIGIAKQLQLSPHYYVGYFYVKDKEAASLLMEQDVLTEVIHKGYTFKHDLYLDWALEYVMEQIITDELKLLNSLPHTVDYQNALMHCLLAMTENGSKGLEGFCGEVFASKIDDFWVPSAFYAIAKNKRCAQTFFETFDAQLKSDNYHWFNEFAKELYVSCNEIKEYFTFKGRQYPRFIPVGYGWNCAIDFMYRNQDDYFLNNICTVYQVLLGFLGKVDACYDEKHWAAVLSLRIFDEEAKALMNGSIFYIKDSEKWCSLVCLYSAFLNKELTQIIRVVVRNKWACYGKPYFQLMEYVVKKANFYEVYPLCIKCFDVLPEILQLFWEEHPEEKEHQAFRDFLYKDDEYYYGLEEGLDGIGGYFPSSALRTPIYPMLMAEYHISPHLHNTIDFIIRFVDQCAEVYKNRGKSQEYIEIIKVISPNGFYKDIIASQVLWNLYRGTAGFLAPNVLECVHMALEKFLLKLCEDKVSKDFISQILAKILNESKSISLWSVVASVAMAYPEDYFNILLVFFQDYHFLSYDLTRSTHELTAKLWNIEGVGHENFVKERNESNELDHRKYNLENWLQGLQVHYDGSETPLDQDRLMQLFACVDKIKEQVSLIPQAEKRHEDFMVARIDYQTLIKDEITLKDGSKAIKVTPKLTSEQKKVNKVIEEDNMQIARCENIREWIECQYSGRSEDNIKSPFNGNPKALLDELRNIEKRFGVEGPSMNKLMGQEMLPCMGSSILLVKFSDLLTPLEIEECKKRVFKALKDDGLFLACSFSGLEICLDAIPALLRLNVKQEDEVEFRKICLTLIRRTCEYANIRFCDLMRYMIVRNEMWKHHTSFMELCLQEIVSSRNPQDATETDWVRGTLCLLADCTSHVDLKLKCMEIMSEEWKPIMKRSYVSYSNDRLDDADLVSDVIINSDKDIIPQILSFFSRFISKEDRYEPLVRLFILKCVQYDRYEEFWIVWNGLYDSMLKGLKKWDSAQIIQEFLLNPSGLKQSDDKWFTFKEKDICFFQRVLSDAGDNPSVLNSVVKVFDSIASEYALRIVPTISLVIKVKDLYVGERSVMKTLIFNLEEFMRRIFADYESNIYNDKQLKQEVKTILLFMKQHESSHASRLLRNI